MKPWEDAFGEVPSSFEDRVQTTLTGLEDNTVKMDNIKKKARPVWRTVLIAAVVAVLLAGTALAAASGGFLQSVFGPKGWDDSPGAIVGDDILPAKEWVTVDEQTAQASVGDYVVTGGTSISAGDYILTVDNYFVDENSFGAIAYTLKRADGGAIPGYRLWDDGYSGQFELDEEWMLSKPRAEASSGASLDRRDVLDKNLTTDTELHSVIYLESLEEIPEGDSLYLYMFTYERAQIELSGVMTEGTAAVGETERIALSTDNRVPARAFSNGEYTIWLTPLSMMLKAPSADWGEDYGVTIRFADGSEYTVISQTPYTENVISGGYISYRHSFFCIFNRLVDADSVVSVTIGGTGATAGEYAPDADAVRTGRAYETEEAYQEYVIEWLTEAVKNSDLPEELLQEELIPAARQMEDFVLWEMLVEYGLIEQEAPMTYEQFIDPARPVNQ